ncbi:hypothetical protein HAX54_044054, partial [Datura stramonium]|nr:hypothetical protein [Datura stramonium]
DLSGERACKVMRRDSDGRQAVWCVQLEFGRSRWLRGCLFLSEFAGSYRGYEVLVVGGFGGAVVFERCANKEGEERVWWWCFGWCVGKEGEERVLSRSALGGMTGTWCPSRTWTANWWA